MSLISRLTTWTAGQLLKSADLNNEFNNIVNTLNNLDSATTSWTNVKATTGTFTTLNVTSLSIPLNAYRRPVLQYSSGTVVNLETGNNGTSGQAYIIFPDGSSRSDSTSGHINCNLAQVAALTGSVQSGVRTGSQTANTWYSIYAVKSQANSNDFVTVADPTLPIQANYSNLNTYFGTNGWSYLGTIRNGDNSGSTNVVLEFYQSGNLTTLNNVCTGNANNLIGTRLATASIAAGSLTYTATSGTGTTDIPNNFKIGYYMATTNSVNGIFMGTAGGAPWFTAVGSPGGGTQATAVLLTRLLNGCQVIPQTSTAKFDICLYGWIDTALGVGSNPLL